jgi:aquaporin Z
MNLTAAIRQHWPEYLIEGWALGMFMISAALVTALVEHPASPVRRTVRRPLARRALIGGAMGLTAIGLIYSPWGERSGAQMNPAVTLTFLFLGKMNGPDAIGYIAGQCLGGVSGLLLAKALLRGAIAHPAVNHVATVPGRAGPAVAFTAEAAISGLMMLMVLVSTNSPPLAPFTGLFAGALVCLFITVEAPLSGMSMNPARTLASALPSRTWTGAWIYFAAPLVGMILAAHLFTWQTPSEPRACPKLHHGPAQPCIFCATGARPGPQHPTAD